MKGKLLIVDDEEDLREILQYNLENSGYEVDTAASAEEALTKLTPSHDLILLDVMLGGISGFTLAQKLRKELLNNVPIIFLTAKDTENDLLTGFSAGGDDYITKPFSIHEVEARVSAVLRRTSSEESAETLQIGEMTLEYASKCAIIGGKEIRLSRKEFGILAFLASKPRHIRSREEILSQVWRGESCVLDRTVDVHIARVRHKLGDYGSHLVNRQGYGYSWE